MIKFTLFFHLIPIGRVRDELFSNGGRLRIYINKSILFIFITCVAINQRLDVFKIL